MPLSQSFKSISHLLSGSRQKKNIFAFILCFFVAAAFWFLNRLNSNFTTTLTYPIEISYDKDLFTFTSRLPDRIRINITGYGWKILDKMYGFHKKPLLLRDDYIFKNKYMSANEIMPFLNQSFSEIKINSISPETLFFAFDQRIVRKVPVILTSELRFRKNYGLAEEPSVIPDSVILEGASSLVNSIKVIKTKTLSGNDLYMNFSADCELDIQNKLGLIVSHKSVNVRCKIDEFMVINKKLRIQKINFPEQFSADSTLPDICNVTFKVPGKESGTIPEDSFIIQADYRYIDPGKQAISVQAIHFPKMVRDFEIINPAFIYVKDRANR